MDVVVDQPLLPATSAAEDQLAAPLSAMAAQQPAVVVRQGG
jgi:hypothetical protein